MDSAILSLLIGCQYINESLRHPLFNMEAMCVSNFVAKLMQDNWGSLPWAGLSKVKTYETANGLKVCLNVSMRCNDSIVCVRTLNTNSKLQFHLTPSSFTTGMYRVECVDLRGTLISVLKENEPYGDAAVLDAALRACGML